MSEESVSGADVEGLKKRLDAIIRLLMDSQLEHAAAPTRGDQILALDSVGLTSGDIGRIVGQSSGNVASTLGKARRARRSR